MEDEVRSDGADHRAHERSVCEHGAETSDNSSVVDMNSSIHEHQHPTHKQHPCQRKWRLACDVAFVERDGAVEKPSEVAPVRAKPHDPVHETSGTPRALSVLHIA
eukprot:1794891-Rhodomonas_salina.5